MWGRCGSELSRTCKHSRKVALQKLTHLIRGWDAVWQEVDAPRTCADWYTRHMACKKALMEICIKGVPRLPIEGGELAYCTSWTIRGVFLLLMHVAKVSQLKAGDLELGRFCHMNPDKSGSLHRVFLAGRGSIGEKYKTIGDLMRAAGRSCRPELLSMDCCFAGDPALDLVDVGDGDLDVSLFRAAKARLIKRYKMTPHIAEVIHEAMRHS